MRAKTLLHILPSFGRGGQQTRLVSIIAHGRPSFRHKIVSLRDDFSARASLPDGAAEFEFFSLRMAGGVSVDNLARLARLMRESTPDLLCTYNFGAIEAALANRLGPKYPHIHYEDGFGGDETIERQKARRKLARRFILAKSYVVVPSRALQSAATTAWGLRQDKVRLIFNGIDLARFHPGARQSGENDPVIVGAMGALRPEKNFARLITAFENAGACRARLVIYGDGPERSDLERRAAGRGERIILAGATDRPEAAYLTFDLFALSSDTEQAPLSVMEAMASGLAIAAPDIGDIRDMVSQENREYITPAGDMAGLASALARLIGDPGLRRRLGAANAARARELFALEPMIDKHEALFDEALARGRL
ncbi:MAG: glycosyltransferase [Alphaproteobacteria bacterium]|nr:glycosyltransferase [Alphaproteobacteria bacterium]